MVVLAALVTACTPAGEDDEPAALPATPRAHDDSGDGGVSASEQLFDSSETVVASSGEPASWRRAAEISAEFNLPLFVVTPENSRDVSDEVGRLGADRVLAVSDESGGGAPEIDVDAEVIDVDVTDESDSVPVEPQTPPHSGDDLRVLITESTSQASASTAAASGAAVSRLGVADPRAYGDVVSGIRAADAVLALGPDWGEDFAERVEQAVTVPELPGGGQVLFPGRRMVGLYGSPVSPALGILGEQGPEAAVDVVRRKVEEYRGFSPEPVIPAFELIGTVAARSSGPGADYSNVWDPEIFEPMVDAITGAGGYALIDLQPGTADFLDQARPFEELLRRPGVGLALDPEWKLTGDQRPAAQVGSVDAAEINRVIDWLAEITRDSGGPQTMLVLHQFQEQMISNRRDVDTSRDEVAVVLHVDGHGTPGEKLDTWNRMLADLPAGMWPAWKNFRTEDSPVFTPEETMAVTPRPWFVSYQ